jgi:Bacterial archaeo-eukaryotic release factor family 3
MARQTLRAGLSSSDLADLRAPRDFPAVSLIMPTHRTPPDSKTDPIVLRNLLDHAAVRLRGENLPHGVADEVIDGLNRAARSVDLNHAAEALAVFAGTGGEHHSFTLPYVHPAPRVAIGLSFAIRDLVAAREHVWDYWVLSLSEQPTRLWSGAGEWLRESNAGGFPMAYSDGLPGERGAVPRPRRAERLKNDRREQFFRHVFGEMATVLARDSRPLVVTGVKRYLAYFEQLSPAAAQSRFIGFVEGSFDQASGPELAGWVAPVLTAERERWQSDAIGRLEVARSERLLASGLTQVWDLAAAGQVRELLAEEGYLCSARESDGHLLPPGDPAGVPVDDAVEVIMDGVLNGGGEVIFVPDGSLEQYGRIAASLRF